MKRGVVYYNLGTKCLIRLSVSLYTLRRSGYTGPVCIIYEGDLPDWFIKESDTRGVTYAKIPDEHRVDWALVQKASLWRYTPFDTSLFIDSDTVVMKNPEELFPQIEEHGFGVTKFSNWTTNGGGIMRGRVNGWRSIIGDEMTDKALHYGPALNTGVFGWVKGHPILPAWESLTRAGHAHGEKNGPATRIIDETACQVLAPNYPHTPLDQSWNRSIKHTTLPVEQTGIVHYHGAKHIQGHDLCYLWTDAYWRMRNTSAVYESISDPHGDRRLTAIEAPKCRADMTVCCAANPNYMPKFMRHFNQWMETKGLREQRYILFVVNAKASDPAYDPIRQWRNVTLIEYHIDVPTIREAAFSAFIFGVAEHVKTPYHLKLDGDSVPKSDFIWPRYTESTITSDPWKYTRNKGTPPDAKHFLNSLDDWWANQADIPEENRKPLFPPLDPKARYRHKRIRSYCCIASTEFIRDVARRCGNRLPAATHDGTIWYAATRLGLPINRHGFRKYITA